MAGTCFFLERHFIKSESDDFTDTTLSMDIGDESTSACIMDTFVASDGLLVMTWIEYDEVYYGKKPLVRWARSKLIVMDVAKTSDLAESRLWSGLNVG